LRSIEWIDHRVRSHSRRESAYDVSREKFRALDIVYKPMAAELLGKVLSDEIADPADEPNAIRVIFYGKTLKSCADRLLKSACMIENFMGRFDA